MAQTEAVPRRPPRIVYTIMNPTFKALLYSPLHSLMSRRLIVLTFSGRKSGKRYSVVVGYAQDGNTLVIPTQSKWSRNLRGGVPVTVRLRGRTRSGVAEVVDDEAGMRAAYQVLLASQPGLAQMLGIGLDANGEPDPADVAKARAQGHVTIRVRLGD